MNTLCSQRRCPQTEFHAVSRSCILSGFTLLELLTVMGIVALMTTLCLPAFLSINGGRGVTQALNDISGSLEMAKATAMTQNTYVWIGFANIVNSNGNSEARIGAVRSMDGSANTASSNLYPIGKLLKIENVQITKSGNLVATALRNMVVSSGSASAVVDGQSQVSFSIGGQSFSKSVLVITPQGQVILSSTVTTSTPFTREIEVAVQPTKGTNVPAGTTDGFALWMSGGNGSLRLFRL